MGSPREIAGDAYEWAGWERVSHGVNCTEFLDRDAAFDRLPGKSVEVRSCDRALTHSIESV